MLLFGSLWGWDSDIVSLRNVQGKMECEAVDHMAIRPVLNLIVGTDDRLLSFAAFLQERSLLFDGRTTGCVYLNFL